MRGRVDVSVVANGHGDLGLQVGLRIEPLDAKMRRSAPSPRENGQALFATASALPLTLGLPRSCRGDVMRMIQDAVRRLFACCRP
jgi:hypothetical protein